MPTFYYTGAEQAAENSAAVTSIQEQGLFIKNSHSILVTQAEIEGLVAAQASILAAIEAIIIAIDARDDLDAARLQALSQRLRALQIERQRVVIADSDNITINQIELQIELAVQAAVQLLAKITAKILEV